MNVNLSSAIGRGTLANYPLGNGPSVMDQLRASASVLAMREDTRPVGPPILVPERQSVYPGEFQAWYPVADGSFIHVDSDGVVQRVEQITSEEDLSWSDPTW